ncbi:hypothetical protein PT110_09425, partial [Erysipelothrix rhusiopathiae]|nr:hypothetical protein [Erysipelothrix rhusiopathiae]
MLRIIWFITHDFNSPLLILGADFTLDGKIKSEQGRGWPCTGEIDIMELIGEDRDGSHGNRT